LGAFLSGGMDSSTIVALMQAQSSRAVKTFTIGFGEETYDEAIFARQVARHLGTDHTELYVTSGDALSVIPKLPQIYDEPFSDSSQIPTYLVSALARQHVTVSLSGDGGDELLGGYSRYAETIRLWKLIDLLPPFLRSRIAKGLATIPSERWEEVVGWLGSLLGGQSWHGRTGDRIHKLAKLIEHSGPIELYLKFLTRDPEMAPRVWGDAEESSPLDRAARSRKKSKDLLGTMSYLDLLAYLPDDILVKVDRAAMAVSLETRVPMLDHEVIEFALSLPSRIKVKDGKGKWPLREILYRYVPQDLVDRPKMGFGVPIEFWLRGPLKEWADTLLNERRIEREGFLDAHRVKRLWNETQSGSRRWHHYLWDVLMFQAWLEESKK